MTLGRAASSILPAASCRPGRRVTVVSGCGGRQLDRLGGDTVSFSAAAFSDGQVNFSAVFSDGLAYFGVVFSGGAVDFSDPGDWSFPPAFPWTDTPPPGVKLPEEAQSQTQANETLARRRAERDPARRRR
jgi:hypothetical protein